MTRPDRLGPRIEPPRPALAPAPDLLPPARLRNLMLLLLAGLGLYLSFRLLRPFADVLIWSVSLAILFAPLHHRIRARLKRPNLAASLTLAIVVLAVLLPVWTVALSLADELSTLLVEAPATIDRIAGNPDAQTRWAELTGSLRSRFPVLERVGRDQIEEGGKKLVERAVQGSFGLLGKIVEGAIRFFFIVFTLFFLLRDGDAVAATVREALPLTRRQADRLATRTVEVLRASTYGVLLVALIQGALGGLMFALLGLPSPVLWGVAMAFFALLPMIGPGIVWAPAVVFLYATDRASAATVLLVWGVLVIGLVDNFLRPRLVGARSRLHELVVFFGVLGGLSVFGLVGVLAGPTLLAVAATLLELARERNGFVPSPAVEGPPEAAAAGA